MNCKNCNAPLEDGPFCPVCGADNSPEDQVQSNLADQAPDTGTAAPQEPAVAEPAAAEPAAEDATAENIAAEQENTEPAAEIPVFESAAPKPAISKKSNKGTIILGVVLAIAVAVIAYLYATKNDRLFFAPDNQTLADGGVYSAETLEAGSKTMDNIVAKVDGEELRNAEFQIYYWMQFYNFMNSYGSYAAYFGLDSTKELSEQDSMEPISEAEGDSADSKMLTWEQYFISTALDNYRQYKALELKAKAEDMEVDETYRSYLDNLEDQLQTAASSAGFATPEEYLQASFGPGVTLEDYKAYMNSYLLAITYSTHLHDNIEYTDDDINSYYDSKADEYASKGMEKIDQNVVNVRHILIQPEQDLDEDGDGTMDASSDEAWAAAEKKANELYAQWQENATEENFTAMATENSADTGTSSNGGLCEDVYPGQMVTEFNDWCFDPSRSAGDSGIVKTTYGYHIIYFVSTGDYVYWFETAKEDYISAQYDTMMQDILDEFPLKVNYSNIAVSTLEAVSRQSADEPSGESVTDTEPETLPAEDETPAA